MLGLRGNQAPLASFNNLENKLRIINPTKQEEEQYMLTRGGNMHPHIYLGKKNTNHENEAIMFLF